MSSTILGKTIDTCLAVYQKTLSPDHSRWGKAFFPQGYCRFYPSCSAYARRTIAAHGVAIGSVKALWRILRCNPFSRGGIDEP